MKQVKQIIEFILVVVNCFFRFKRQQKDDPCIPSDPYPPGIDTGRKRDCHCSTGCSCNPEPAQPPESTGPPGGRSACPVTGNNEAPNAATLLGWCLIIVAGTSYLYKLLV